MRLYYLFTDTTIMISTYRYIRSIFISEYPEEDSYLRGSKALYIRGLGNSSRILMFKKRGKPLRIKMVLQ